MKYLLTYTPTSKDPPSPETMIALGKYAEEMSKSGVLLMTGGLQRPSKGTRILRTSGNYSVTDGPFAETKELIDGFALIQASSKDEAIAHAKRFMNIVGDGEGEVLEVFDSRDMPS